jgi:hypothetical protein
MVVSDAGRYRNKWVKFKLFRKLKVRESETRERERREREEEEEIVSFDESYHIWLRSIQVLVFLMVQMSLVSCILH